MKLSKLVFLFGLLLPFSLIKADQMVAFSNQSEAIVGIFYSSPASDHFFKNVMLAPGEDKEGRRWVDSAEIFIATNDGMYSIYREGGNMALFGYEDDEDELKQAVQTMPFEQLQNDLLVIINPDDSVELTRGAWGQPALPYVQPKATIHRWNKGNYSNRVAVRISMPVSLEETTNFFNDLITQLRERKRLQQPRAKIIGAGYFNFSVDLGMNKEEVQIIIDRLNSKYFDED